MIYVIAAHCSWYNDYADRLHERTGHQFVLISEKHELTRMHLDTIQPRCIFLPHWSHKVPDEVYESFECVIFHMTDLPFGRGGSPLQNLIARGVYETRISALKCTAEVDAGPVYLKRPLSLYGTAEEIYMRAARVVEGMIVELIKNEALPVEQEGDVVHFARRKPEDGDISELSELTEVFDYIRMLDAEGYPNAFLETEHFRFEFKRPSLKHGKVVADVTFTRKG